MSCLAFRTVSLFVPLLQRYFRGLRIHAPLRIISGHIKIDPSLMSGPGQAAASTPGGAGPSSSAAAKRKYHLHSADHTFAMLRDENFVVVGPKLGKEVRRLEAEIKVRSYIQYQQSRCRILLNCKIVQARHQAQTINQLRDFVGKLGGIQNDRQAAGLRLYSSWPVLSHDEGIKWYCSTDISLSEEINSYTHTDDFQRGVDIEHSKLRKTCHPDDVLLSPIFLRPSTRI